MTRLPVFAIILLLLIGVTAPAKDLTDEQLPIPRIHQGKYLDSKSVSQTFMHPHASITADTFVLGDYSFDDSGGPNAQGWIGQERYTNWEPGIYFHVADTTELYGGDYGRLIVLEGDHSMWCGASATISGKLCYYATLPGYGNGWAQYFETIKMPYTGDVTISYLVIYDSEPAEDISYLQYLNKDGYWHSLAAYDYWLPGDTTELESFLIPDSVLTDSLQVRFAFYSDGAWSDEDGLWPTDGAIVIDSLTLSDAGGVISFQDFEAEPVGATMTNDGHWFASRPAMKGDFSGLFSGLTVLQEDGCIGNASALWGFFNGSTEDYSCGGHPEQLAVPTGDQQGFYLEDVISNEIWSPFIDWDEDMHGTPIPSTADVAIFEFDVYRDLPLANLVFYDWFLRSVVDSCAGKWQSDSYLYYGDRKDWYHHRVQIAGYIEPGADAVQLALRAVDMCPYWCGLYGDGLCHSHAPLFDNPRLVRVDIAGPSWEFAYGYITEGMFQDNFATDGTLTGTVRMDGPNLESDGSPRDEVTVWVTSQDGIDFHVPGEQSSGPAVYCHIKDVSPTKSGSAVSDDVSKFPLIATGGGWTVLQCYSSRPDKQGPEYTIDLSDGLYQPGDTVWYYFSGRDVNGNTNYWSNTFGATMSEAEIRENLMEVTCLPANALSGATDILYVDGFDSYGAQPYFESAFEMLGLTPDRYDVLSPTIVPGSGPGARVADVVQQLASVYETIIWNTGYFRNAGINDGIEIEGFKKSSDDFGILHEFLDQSPNSPGVYLSGDNLATWWLTRTGNGAVNLRSTYMNFNVVNSSHIDAGEPVTPLVIGFPYTCFDHPTDGVDTLLAYGGGCSGLNDFDVLEPYGPAGMSMAYSQHPLRGAVLTQATQNVVGDTASVILSGFSFHEIRDYRSGLPLARAHHLEAILNCLESGIGSTVDEGNVTPLKNSLSVNYPNPFNPATMIDFTVAVRGHVELAIYDVAGRRIRVLVSGVRSPGLVHHARWNGRDDGGRIVASGVYFYRLRADGFTQTHKMVLLK
jgi:hypothetical protein